MMILNSLLFLLFTASVLLLLGMSNRKTRSDKNLVDIAIFKIASRIILEESGNGVLYALSEHGLIDGKAGNIRRYNAESDMPSANMIAQIIVNNSFGIVITIN